MALKIGLVGAGHLGKIHMKCIQALGDLEFVGFYDVNDETREQASKQFGVRAFSSIDALYEEADVIDIVTPTTTHHELAKKAILMGKPCFIEKPITSSSAEAQELLELSRRHNVICQVGHVERFNPALLSLQDMKLNPKFLEVHRLAFYNPRSTDVSVIHDLMIHDVDILMHLMKDTNVKEVRSNGVKILSPTVDICNARVTFENGAVANLTASRMSLKPMRKMRIFQENAYVSIDFLEKESQVVHIENNASSENTSMPLETPHGTKYITVDKPVVPEVNAIQEELQQFHDSVMSQSAPAVSVEDGLRALRLVEEIANNLNK